MRPARAASGRAGRGFTRFEFAVCATVLALLAGIMLPRLLAYRAQLERATALQLVAAARTGMAVRIAHLAIRGGNETLETLAQENPMTWLAYVPDNYQGEYYDPASKLIKPGYWYFDQSDKSINFLLSDGKFSSGTSNLLKFKVELVRQPFPPGMGRSEATLGLVLGQVHDRVASNNH